MVIVLKYIRFMANEKGGYNRVPGVFWSSAPLFVTGEIGIGLELWVGEENMSWYTPRTGSQLRYGSRSRSISSRRVRI